MKLLIFAQQQSDCLATHTHTQPTCTNKTLLLECKVCPAIGSWGKIMSLSPIWATQWDSIQTKQISTT